LPEFALSDIGGINASITLGRRHSCMLSHMVHGNPATKRFWCTIKQSCFKYDVASTSRLLVHGLQCNQLKRQWKRI